MHQETNCLIVEQDQPHANRFDFFKDNKYLNLVKTSLDDIEFLKLDGGGIALCITIYNEPVEALISSLSAIVNNIEFMLREGTIIDIGGITICIVVDGGEALASSTRMFLEDFGFFFNENDDSTGIQICKASIYLKRIKEIISNRDSNDTSGEFHWGAIYKESLRLGSQDSSTHHVNAEIIPIQLLVGVKNKNAGKLDSHWWFYKVFCQVISPAFCIQMDVGTAPVNTAISETIKVFNDDKTIGAVASGIYLTSPDGSSDFLKMWQFITFAKCMLVEWPAEVASGYLSVIPGQFSAIRWDALKNSRDSDVLDQPLDIYFKGLGALKPSESILYLAEDRVLCAQIATRPESKWKLGFAKASLAITDYCHSFEELLRQRKRWCNGYLACRISFLSQMSEYLSRKNLSANERLSMFFASVYQLLLLIKDWFFPSFILYSYVDLAKIAVKAEGASSISGVYISTLSLLMSASIIFQFIACYRGKLDKVAKGIFAGSILLQTLFILSCTVAIIKNGEGMFALMMAVAYIAVIPLAMAIFHARQFIPVLKYSVQTIALLPASWFAIWMYAICNAHDNSWGTKGLETPGYASSKEAALSHQQEQYSIFRNTYVLSWLGLNCICFAVLLYFFRNNSNFLPILLGLLAGNSLFGFFSSIKSKLFK
jgi:chitin synthase